MITDLDSYVTWGHLIVACIGWQIGKALARGIRAQGRKQGQR